MHKLWQASDVDEKSNPKLIKELPTSHTVHLKTYGEHMEKYFMSFLNNKEYMSSFYKIVN